MPSMGSMTPLRWVLLVLCGAAAFVLWPLWPSLVLAAWTAALVRPVLVRFERGLKGRRRAAAVLSLVLFLVVILPVVLVVLGVVGGAQELLTTLKTSPSASGALRTLISSPDSAATVPTSFAEVLPLLQRSGAQGIDLLTWAFGAAANGVIGLFLYFGGAYALLVDAHAAWAWFKGHSPLRDEHADRLAAAFHETGRGLLIGVGLTCVAQGLRPPSSTLHSAFRARWCSGR